MTTTTTPPRDAAAAALARQKREADLALQHLVGDFEGNPAAMQYFYDLYRRLYVEGEPLAHAGKLIGTTCVHVPTELIYALGATPLRLCSGSHQCDQVGADLMPAKSCALVKATLGLLYAERRRPQFDNPDLIVNPTTCDQKKKAAAMIRDMGYAVYDLEMPSAKESEEARLYWQRSVRQLALTLCQVTGQRLTRRNLRAALARSGRAQAAYRRLHQLRQHSPALILGKDAFLVAHAFFFDDLERWTAAVEALNAELEQRQADGCQAAQRKAPRLLFTGSPPVFPNLKLPLLIEAAGGVVVADETCAANRMLYDATAVGEWQLDEMVDSLADRYLKPCTCPIFTSHDDRERRLLELAAGFAVDGVVYQVLAGCQVYEMEQKSISAALQAKGLPVLCLETDYSPDDEGQLTTRIEAFLESIRARRRKSA
jgi:benzoyl-CoA reductase/2-hydroxyglutaryl-CoA dehydratase subunit BcrC/BadD/HgdB